MKCDCRSYQMLSPYGRFRDASAMTTSRIASAATVTPASHHQKRRASSSTRVDDVPRPLVIVATLGGPDHAAEAHPRRRGGWCATRAPPRSGGGDQPAQVPELLGLGAQRELERLHPLEVPVDRVVEVDADAAVHVQRRVTDPAATLRRPELGGGDLHAGVGAGG